MASTSTDTANKVSIWRRLADALEIMEEGPAERQSRALEARLGAFEARLDALEQTRSKS